MNLHHSLQSNIFPKKTNITSKHIQTIGLHFSLTTQTSNLQDSGLATILVNSVFRHWATNQKTCHFWPFRGCETDLPRSNSGSTNTRAKHSNCRSPWLKFCPFSSTSLWQVEHRITRRQSKLRRRPKHAKYVNHILIYSLIYVNAVRICMYICKKDSLYTCTYKKDFCTCIGRFGESQSDFGVSQYQVYCWDECD